MVPLALASYQPTSSKLLLPAYLKTFDKETNEEEADFSDVYALYEALNADRTDIDKWKKDLEKIFDVDGFIKWLAVNTLSYNFV